MEKIMQKIAPTKRTGAIIVALAAGALLLSGCAATAGTPSSTPASSGQPAQSTQAPGGGGISGTIAAVSDGTLQVQGGTTQTAVNYTATTTITQAVAAVASDVTVGSCVTGITTPGASSGTAATTVAITTAVGGTCPAPGPRGGAPGGGQGGVRPSGAPNGTRPSGAPGGGRFTPPVSGTVTAVTGTTITVSTTSQSGSKITLDGSTKYTKSQAATSAALVVNECVIAAGKADTSGNFAATSLAVSDPGANGCSLGGRPGAGNPGAGN
jgi:hypothetical protein